MQKGRSVLGGVGLWLTLSGCSIAMALSGTPEPNFDAFEIGSSRQQVEIQLGTPRSSEPLENGQQRDTYRFQMGNVPNGHRALMNLYIDLGTLFLYELPGTVIEASMGHWEETQVVYDAGDRVVAIQGYRPPPPSKELKKAQEAQKAHSGPSQTPTADPAPTESEGTKP